MPAGARGESPPSLPASPSALSSLPLPAAAAQGRRERRRQAEPPGPAEAGGRAGGRAVAAPRPRPGRAAGRLRPALPWRGGSAPGEAALPVAPRRAEPSRADAS